MLCSQIGKRTPRPVALGNTNATVGLYFQGNSNLFYFYLLPQTFVGRVYIWRNFYGKIARK